MNPIIKSFAITLYCTASLPILSQAIDFYPAENWDEALGNPIVEDGKPLWRADYVSPGDPLDAAAYQPMVWKGKFWAPEDGALMQATWPSISTTTKGVRLVSAGKWGNSNFRKISALIFIAPKAGKYHVLGQAHNRMDQGDQEVTLMFIKREEGHIAVVDEIKVPKDETVDLPSAAVELEAGEELALVPVFDVYNNATFLTLLDFRITDEAPAK